MTRIPGHPLVTRDPAIQRGRWILRGTRFPTDTLIGWNGDVSVILDAYPHLTRKQVEAALRFEASVLRRLGRLRRRVGLWLIGEPDE